MNRLWRQEVGSIPHYTMELAHPDTDLRIQLNLWKPDAGADVPWKASAPEVCWWGDLKQDMPLEEAQKIVEALVQQHVRALGLLMEHGSPV